MNRLVIPEMDADMESLRSDLRKLIKLHGDMSQVVEALSAAVLQIRDKLELPAAPAKSVLPLPTPSPTEGASSPADARTELVQKEVGEGLREKVVRIREAWAEFLLHLPDGVHPGVGAVTEAITAALTPAPKPDELTEDEIRRRRSDRDRDLYVAALEKENAELRAPKPAPPTFKVPFQKPLTVLLIQDRSQEQASTDVATIKKNDSTVLRIGSEMYFNQLRLECAKDPTLLDKIAVFYRDENNVLHSVGLSFEDELKWPPGFLQEAWSLEAEISKVRHPALAAPAPKPAPPAEPQCICAQGVTKCRQHGEQPAERGTCPKCGAVLAYCVVGEYCTKEGCNYAY